MCQPEAHWFLKQKIPLFHPLQIWTTKTMCVISNVSYSIQLVEKCYCRYCSLIVYDFIWLIPLFLFVQSILTACSRIPVNKGTNPRLTKKWVVCTKFSTLAAISIHCVCSLEPTFPRIRTRKDLGLKRPWDERENKTKEKYLYIRCCILIRFTIILPYLESKGKIDIHQYRSHTCLQ